MEKTIETIKRLTEEILSIMGFRASVQVKQEEGGSIVANIASEEGGFLIGQGGENLYALQHIIRMAVFKELGEGAKNFVLDVNDYRQGKVEILREMALDRAEKAAREGRDIALSPMSPYERRIIHMVLAGRKDIVCESEGEGNERHIVIRPV